MNRKERVDRWVADVLTQERSLGDRFMAIAAINPNRVRFSMNSFTKGDLQIMTEYAIHYGLLVIHWDILMNMANQCISVTVALDESHEPEIDRFMEALNE